jgi:hypothetical protein
VPKWPPIPASKIFYLHKMVRDLVGFRYLILEVCQGFGRVKSGQPGLSFGVLARVWERGTPHQIVGFAVHMRAELYKKYREQEGMVDTRDDRFTFCKWNSGGCLGFHAPIMAASKFFYLHTRLRGDIATNMFLSK